MRYPMKANAEVGKTEWDLTELSSARIPNLPNAMRVCLPKIFKATQRSCNTNSINMKQSTKDAATKQQVIIACGPFTGKLQQRSVDPQTEPATRYFIPRLAQCVASVKDATNNKKHTRTATPQRFKTRRVAFALAIPTGDPHHEPEGAERAFAFPTGAACTPR